VARRRVRGEPQWQQAFLLGMGGVADGPNGGAGSGNRDSGLGGTQLRGGLPGRPCDRGTDLGGVGVAPSAGWVWGAARSMTR
jgi:hypothetical protein